MPVFVLGFMIRYKQGHVVWGANTWHTRQIQENLRSGKTVFFKLPITYTFGPDSYSVSSALASCETHLSDNYEWIDNLLVFYVINVNRDFFVGSDWLDANFFPSPQSDGRN